VQNRVTATWVLNHQFLELRMRDVAQPPQYEAIVLIGYVHSDRAAGETTMPGSRRDPPSVAALRAGSAQREIDAR
jgi:hypothetical protein